MQVSDLKHLLDKIKAMELSAQSHPAMEKVFQMLPVFVTTSSVTSLSDLCYDPYHRTVTQVLAVGAHNLIR